MKNKIFIILILVFTIFIFSACDDQTNGDIPKDIIGWNGKSVTYKASDIKNFGSATPAGMANYLEDTDTVAIWNVDASLDNYGGIQTPLLTLDFSKAVIFEMEVVSSYSQYIVKLAVEGELEYYYVLSDEGTTGTISINVVDAMLSSKYRTKNTQPDPGYATGWKYDNLKKNCTFHILAKGPDGEKQTAELVLKKISIINDQTAVTKVEILSTQIDNEKIEALKGSNPISLTSKISPESVTNKNVIWTSSNPKIASVNQEGLLSFIGVGKTYIMATSALDQSKSTSILVDVKSGFENPSELTTKLKTLNYDGSSNNLSDFTDLFNTSWASESDMSQTVNISSRLALNYHIENNIIKVENYFDLNNPNHVNEAANYSNLNKAYTMLSLNGGSNATVYRNINGKLYQEIYEGGIKVNYADYTNQWSKMNTYQEQTIIVWANGTVKKYSLNVVSTTLVKAYMANDFVNTNLWTIPDRTKQNLDGVIHALSPASITINNDIVTVKQNKYPEAKYCFGGIVSNILTADISKELEIVINVHGLNQMNDFVKTMWEIKIIYYQNDSVVSSNPLKVESGNTTGTHTFKFMPAYDNFRIYLVVNGSDIGAQFADATMQIKSLKLQILD